MHPGANIIEQKRFGKTIKIALLNMRKEEARTKVARGIQVGDVVHRHVRDGE